VLHQLHLAHLLLESVLGLVGSLSLDLDLLLRELRSSSLSQCLLLSEICSLSFSINHSLETLDLVFESLHLDREWRESCSSCSKI